MTRTERSNGSSRAYANKHKKKMVFQHGALVWIHLRRYHFPSKIKSKLMSRANGPFQMLERVNDNSYKVNFSRNYSVSATFNEIDF